MQRGTFHVGLDEVVVKDGRRPVDETSVKRLAKSIRSIGLQHPITVRSEGGKFALIAGRHRLEAYRLLGEESIPADVVKMDKIDAEMWEISENLHRAELSALEHSQQVARWIVLSTEKREAELRSGSERKDRGRPESGVNEAARELGIAKTTAWEDTKIDALSDEAKAAAIAAGLDDNRTALLRASREATPAAQIEALKPKEWEDVEAEQRKRLMNAWNAASPNVKAWFRETMDAPVMDARYGT